MLALTGCAAGVAPPFPSPSSTGIGVSDAPITYDGTKAGYLKALAQCLRDAGWDAKFIHEGGRYSIDSGAPPSQTDAYIADSDACVDRLGRPWAQPLTEDRARQVYDAALAMAKCLETAGFPVSTPPSFATFYDDLRSTDGNQWAPDEQIPNNDIRRADAACPEPNSF